MRPPQVTGSDTNQPGSVPVTGSDTNQPGSVLYRPHRSVDSAISTTISTDSKFRAHRNLLIVESQSVVIAVSFKGRTEALIDYQNCPQSALIYQLTMGAPGHLYCIDSIELAMKLGAG